MVLNFSKRINAATCKTGSVWVSKSTHAGQTWVFIWFREKYKMWEFL